MKLPLLVAALVISALAPAFAITDADITPAALAGKTLTFSIETAGGGFADTGTWTGTFGSPTFTVTKLTGNTVNITTTHSIAVNGFTIVTLPQYLAGSGTTTITLFTADGIGRYEMNLSPVDAAYQIGSFTIGAPVVKKAPEILVAFDRMNGNGEELRDGKSTINLGGRDSLGNPNTYGYLYIKNTGTLALKNLRIRITGPDREDFFINKLKRTELLPGRKMALVVYYNPTRLKTKMARMHILSDDKDESSFDINLVGRRAWW